MSGRRGSSLGPAEMFILNQWAAALRVVFEEPPILVGSVTRAEAWRDVDVRLMLDQDRWDTLTNHGDADQLQILNVAFTMWGQRCTGLPIDFQFQQVDEANAEYPTGQRIPLGFRHRRKQPSE